MDIFTKHQIKIAKQTLKYSDAGALVMGGMTKEQAKEILRKHGILSTPQILRDEVIARLEEED